MTKLIEGQRCADLELHIFLGQTMTSASFIFVLESAAEHNATVPMSLLVERLCEV